MVSVSITIIMIGMRKKYTFNYKPILKNLGIILLSSGIMVLASLFAKNLITISPIRIIKVVQCGIIGAVVIAIYLALTYLMGAMKDILGEDFLKNFLKKFKKTN